MAEFSGCDDSVDHCGDLVSECSPGVLARDVLGTPDAVTDLLLIVVLGVLKRVSEVEDAVSLARELESELGEDE